MVPAVAGLPMAVASDMQRALADTGEQELGQDDILARRRHRRWELEV